MDNNNYHNFYILIYNFESIFFVIYLWKSGNYCKQLKAENLAAVSSTHPCLCFLNGKTYKTTLD